MYFQYGYINMYYYVGHSIDWFIRNKIGQETQISNEFYAGYAI